MAGVNERAARRPASGRTDRNRGGFGGGKTLRLSASGSLPGSSIRSVSGWIPTTPVDDGACNVLTMQIAISGQSAQSTGFDWSGQHGMSADTEAAPPDMEAIDMDAAGFAVARAVSGAYTRPAIKKTANSRQRWIERFTSVASHNPAHDWKSSSITKPRVSLT